MEGLILLLAGFLALPSLAGLAVLLDLVVLGIDLVVHLFVSLAGRVRRRSGRAGAPAQATKRHRIPWKAMGRWIGIVGTSLLVLAIIVVSIANWFFFDAIVRSQLAGVKEKTGITVTFGSANGNLWTGVVALHNVEFKRTEDESSQFDLSAETFRIDLSTIDLLLLDAVFEQVEVQGLRGTYDRVGLPEKLKLRKTFRLDRLKVSDVAIEVRDHTRRKNVVQAQLQIESLVAEPLRSEWAVFDLLFRTDAKGRVNGRDFSIATHEIPDGRQTRWQGDGLPVELLGAYLGGPLNWVTAGRLDIDVTDRWQLGDSAEIEMHWDVVLRDVKAEVPPDASRMTRVVAQPTVALLNKHSVRLPLKFDVVVDRERFHFAASPEAMELGRTIGDALADELGKLAGLKPKAIKEATAKKWGQFKDFLDKRRKRNHE